MGNHLGRVLGDSLCVRWQSARSHSETGGAIRSRWSPFPQLLAVVDFTSAYVQSLSLDYRHNCQLGIHSRGYRHIHVANQNDHYLDSKCHAVWDL